MSTLEQQRQAAFSKLTAIGTARRGQLTEQYNERIDREGKVRRNGPYYIWQRWVRGQKHSFRVPHSDLARVRADLQRGREVQEIFDELWNVMEHTAIEQDVDSKKNSRLSKPPVTAKSRNS